MSIDLADQDEILAWGNPWHGALQGSTLVTGVGVEMEISAPAVTPDTHLVEFPGLPVPVTPPADLALGIEFKNYALLYERERRYSPKSGTVFGRHQHIYLTDDHSHYHVLVEATAASGSIADGAAWNLPCTVVARKSANGTLAPAQTLVALQNLSITGIGGSAGHYGQVSTFSPNGKKFCIAIHKYATAQHAEDGDVRRSLGCAGIWEVVLSAGSASAPPTAVLTQIKSSADYFASGGTTAVLTDVSASGDLDTISSSGSQSTNDENGNPLPDGQIRAWGTRSIEWKINQELLDISPQGEPEYWNQTSYIEILIGAAYDDANTLKVFSYREEFVASNTNSVVGPLGVITTSYEAILTGAGGTVVRWISRSSDINRSRNLARTVVQSIMLKMNGVAAVTKTINRNYSFSEATVESYDNSLNWVQSVTSGPTESYSKTMDGAATTLLSLSFKVTSNNTQALVNGLSAYAFCAPSGMVGTPQTLTLDSYGLPWAAWNPKTDALATTPGWSWC